jgi:hypothetical protein
VGHRKTILKLYKAVPNTLHLLHSFFKVHINIKKTRVIWKLYWHMYLLCLCFPLDCPGLHGNRIIAIEIWNSAGDCRYTKASEPVSIPDEVSPIVCIKKSPVGCYILFVLLCNQYHRNCDNTHKGVDISYIFRTRKTNILLLWTYHVW